VSWSREATTGDGVPVDVIFDTSVKADARPLPTLAGRRGLGATAPGRRHRRDRLGEGAYFEFY
jgi:hypothetical protein